jgi:hypothetical protein
MKQGAQSMKIRISAAEAGRRGGRSKSAKKLAACRRNGFQKTPALETKPTFAPTLVAQKEQQS